MTTEQHELTPLAVEIAKHLPGEWEVKPTFERNPEDRYPPSTPCLNRKDGVRLQINKEQRKLSISHFRPTRKNAFVDVGRTASAINVGLSKSPEQIAKDISRRILPEAEAITLAVFQKISEEESWEKERLNTLHQVANAAGVAVRYDRKYSNENPPKMVPDLDRPYYEVTFPGDSSKWGNGYAQVVVHGDSVEIKLSSVPKAQAIKVIKFLKEEVFQQ